MKRVIAIVLVALSAINVSAQFQPLVKMAKNVVSLKVEKHNGEYQVVGVNDDVIDYTLFTKGGNTCVTLKPGHNVVEHLSAKSSNAEQQQILSQVYKIFPGKVIKSDATNALYALPVKNGDKVRCRPNSIKTVVNRTDSVRIPCFQFALKDGDSIYAVRSGVVCQYVSDKTKVFYLYHGDGTFTLYDHIDYDLKPGQKIEVGTFVGTKQKKFRMFFFHLDKDSYEETGVAYKTFSPLFHTTAGDVRIEDEQRLEALIDEKLK